MDIQNKTALVLGGWGLVGTAVARKLVQEKPKQVIITSLRLSEAQDAVKKLVLADEKVSKHLDGKKVIKEIYVRNKIYNIVVK
jgi:NAD(P)-dependent dehydrogenase (short-subunit alcohol dehydrogenase family)